MRVHFFYESWASHACSLVAARSQSCRLMPSSHTAPLSANWRSVRSSDTFSSGVSGSTSASILRGHRARRRRPDALELGLVHVHPRRTYSSAARITPVQTVLDVRRQSCRQAADCAGVRRAVTGCLGFAKSRSMSSASRWPAGVAEDKHSMPKRMRSICAGPSVVRSPIPRRSSSASRAARACVRPGDRRAQKRPTSSGKSETSLRSKRRTWIDARYGRERKFKQEARVEGKAKSSEHPTSDCTM